MVVKFCESVKEKPLKDNVQWHEFLSLESPHPYGVLPWGNRFLLGNQMEKPAENEAFFGRIQDESWLQILSYCDGNTLSQVVQTCRYFYVTGHQPELWRDLVLREVNAKKKDIQTFENCWKDTYVSFATSKKTSHQPMKMPIFSDYLHRLFMCSNFATPRSWLEKCDIKRHNACKGLVPRVLKEDMTSAEFVREYERPNKPVCIEGAATTWACFQKWRNPMYLQQQTQGRTFRATSGMAPLPAQFTLEAFQQYCNNRHLEEGPLYLFDRAALTPNSQLHSDYYPDLRQTCPFWDPSQLDGKDQDTVGHDLFRVLGEGKRPDHTWLILGGNHSGSVFHVDPNCTHAWNAAICGRKRWIFYPPGVPPPGVHPSADGDEVALPLSVGEWILAFWKEHQERKKTAPIHERPLEVTAFPGDVMFVPHGWWHMVINLDDTNLAITHNYVSRSNLGNLLRFLKRHQDQISGCRDRKESIKPEFLHDALVTALQQKFGKDADWLLHAQQQAASHWTCAAWNDGIENDNITEEQMPKKQKLAGEMKHTQTACTSGISVMSKAKAGERETDSNNAHNAAFSFSFI